ncbi:amino acid adenylation domain-containing protein, partial [Desulfobacter sp.]|uniref:amino acid adenylation domain-containing protein n=1 Tax=Desulfobacter sp. TaxID=2294 RepID=UPI003D0C4880
MANPSILEWLIKEISLKTNQGTDEVDIQAPFSYIGINSLDLVSIVNNLGNRLNREFPATLGFDYPTIRALSDFLEKDSNYNEPDSLSTNLNCLREKSEILKKQTAYEIVGTTPDPTKFPRESIAVVGLGCRFPGGCNNPEAFWKFIETGGDGITEVPADRWDIDSFYDANPDTLGKMTTRWGGFIDQIDQFDPAFFGISPREARGIDPQQRLIMEVGWETLEDAGELPAQLKGSSTGVFVGISGSDYGRLLFKDPLMLDLYSGTGNSTSIAANRLSYFLGLRGPSIAVDTACSSSLVAVDLACQSLNNVNCDLALAGGVNLILSPEMNIVFSKARLMALDGRCKTFDSSADGYVRSEGCGMVALKRYSDALNDGNRIYGLIRGTHVNQDGESNGLTVPNGLAQEMLIRESLRKAGIKPSQINYAETHGTGTAIGDPIEVNSLGKVLGEERKSTKPLIIGSVKTNIGHLEQAAGIAGLIKVLLSLKHNKIPPHLHFKEINPLISLDSIPALIPQKQIPWVAGQEKRIATVSGFSFGGVNAHVVIEEAPASYKTNDKYPFACHLLTLSARNEDALVDMAGQYKKYLESHPNTDAAAFCYTANALRSDFSCRLALTGEDIRVLEKELTNFANNLDSHGITIGKGRPGNKPAFIFTGQGSQYPGMGRELYKSQPVFRQEMDRCHAILMKDHQISLLSLLYDDHDTDLLNQTANTQPALFSLEYSMARMYQAWGIKPSVVMGHSVGEFVAACIADVFSLEDALKLITARGKLIQNLPRDGKMVVLFTNISRVEASIAPFGEDLSIAAVNGPENIVVSGVGNAVDTVCNSLSSDGIQCFILPVSHAFHSVLMEPMIEDFRKIAMEIAYAPPQLSYISNVTGRMTEKDEVCSPDYWCRHIRSTVKFEESIRTLHDHGCDLFLEIGPNPVLSGMAKTILPKEDVYFAASLKRGIKDARSVLEGLGVLYTQGVTIDWGKQSEPCHKTVLSLPTYPFQRKRCWLEEKNIQQNFLEPQSGSSAFHPSNGTLIEIPMEETIYQYLCDTTSYFLDDHRVYNHAVMSGSTMVSMIIHKMEDMLGSRICRIESMFIREALYIPDNETRIVQIVFSQVSKKEVSFKVCSADQHDSASKKQWRIHAEGEAKEIFNNKISSHSDPLFSPEIIKNRCQNEISAKDLYSDIRKGGLELEPHFKWLERIWRRDGEAFAEMRLPGKSEKYEKDVLPPGLIDSCTQLLFACFNFDKKNAYMFLGFDRFDYYGNPFGRLFCHMELQTEALDTELAVGNYRLWDENKRLIVEAKGIHLKQAPLEIFINSLGNKGLDPFYKVQWQLSERGETKRDALKIFSDKWLVLDDGHGEGSSLAQAFQSKGISHILEYLDDHGKDQSGNRINGFEKRIEDLLEEEQFTGIVNMCSMDQTMPGSLFYDRLSPDITMGCELTLALARVLSRTTNNDPPKLWIVTRGALTIEGEKSSVNPVGSPLWGMGKVMSLEHPEFFGGLADLSLEAGDIEFSRLVQELVEQDGEDQIVLRGDNRYIPRLKPVEEDKLHFSSDSFSKDAVYLVTGGLGGLGMRLSTWLVEKGARHLVLMGRTSPSPETEKHILEFEEKGVDVRVVQGGVNDGTVLEKVFNDIFRTMPPLKGVFHLAGVVDDGMLNQLEWTRFVDVLAPKVMGAWNLHMLTKDLHLDHFVLFSSTASLLGSPGQGNYAAGNHFMDTLAELRKRIGLPGLSINWGPWAEIGMAAALKSGDMKRWEKGGFTPLTVKKGFMFLEELLGSGNSQVAVMDINWDDYVRYYLNNTVPPVLSQIISNFIKKPAPSESVTIERLNRINEAKSEEKEALVSELISSYLTKIMWLDAKTRIDLDLNLMEMGLDSLMVIELRNQFRKDLGVELSLTEFLKQPTIRKLSGIVLNRFGKLKSTETDKMIYPRILPRPDQRYDPFPLTDIQYAYWMGRRGELSLGDVSCHIYAEVEMVDLDLDRFSKAISKLVNRHEMLKAVILSDGRQQILENVPAYEVNIQDLRCYEPGYTQRKLKKIRNCMSHQIHPSETGPLFEIRASLLDKGITRLHISFDLLIGDGWSFNILINDLYRYYLDPETDFPSIEISFRDYVLTQEAVKHIDFYQQSMEYWKKRIPHLPPAPDLPLAKNPEEIKKQHFIRLESRMEKEPWKHLKHRAAKAGLTPSGVLLAAFSEIIAAWSKSPDFTINLTMFNRLPLHDQVNEIVGDFTTLTLLEVNNDGRQSFETRARNIQERLWQDLEFRHMSGVEVLREIARQKGGGSNINFPVVFTSVLPYSSQSGDSTAIGLPSGLPVDLVYCISQTPQVWLDHQIFEQNGALTFNWDAVEGLFPEGMLEDMFEAYSRLINRLADEENAWQEIKAEFIPEYQAEMRTLVNDTAGSISRKMLHTLFDKQASINPEKEAVVSSTLRMTYHELACRAANIGLVLREEGALPNSLIAVVMEKGWEQVVGVLGVLYSGAAYLPVDASMPKERLHHILKNGNVDLALTQSWRDKDIDWPEGVKRFSVDKAGLVDERAPLVPVQDINDLAYVIYTSGSTGEPKGVMIDHRGAVNTILDINKRFDIGAEDRVIGLAELSFDLSVYDIFGTLATGGTLILPDAKGSKDPAHWLKLMETEQVSVWNSVPQLMQMLLTYIPPKMTDLPKALRLVLLSGDWIPRDLPGNIISLFPGTEIVSLGGATEASIWSILHPIEKVGMEGNTVPYGRPMTNQRFYVLNKNMNPCPDWVTGELYIGGMGLAKGYWRDEEKTARSFIKHPVLGGRLYKTGDMGRYLPDGNIEFQGREDFQVKLNGYRIELGEIEAAIKDHPSVKDTVVSVRENQWENSRLTAYVVPDLKTDSPIVKTVEVDPSDSEAFLNLLKTTARLEAEKRLNEMDFGGFKVFHDYMKEKSLETICRVLNGFGFFIHSGERWSQQELMDKGKIHNRFRTVLGQWLDLLIARGLLNKDGDGFYTNFEKLGVEKEGQAFCPEIEQYGWLAENIHALDLYLERIGRHLIPLLKGNDEPLEYYFSDENGISPEALIKVMPGT